MRVPWTRHGYAHDALWTWMMADHGCRSAVLTITDTAGSDKHQLLRRWIECLFA